MVIKIPHQDVPPRRVNADVLALNGPQGLPQVIVIVDELLHHRRGPDKIEPLALALRNALRGLEIVQQFPQPLLLQGRERGDELVDVLADKCLGQNLIDTLSARPPMLGRRGLRWYAQSRPESTSPG